MIILFYPSHICYMIILNIDNDKFLYLYFYIKTYKYIFTQYIFHNFIYLTKISKDFQLKTYLSSC